MKTTWYVKYEIINKPGIRTFDTLEEATLFARKIMKKHSEIPKHLSSVRKGNREVFRGAVADFLKKYPDVTVAENLDEILNDKDIKLVASADIPSKRCPLGIKVMEAGKDYFADKAPLVTLEQLDDARNAVRKTGRSQFFLPRFSLYDF